MAVIYRHLKPDGTVFYIGIGKKDKRAYDKNGRNPHWKRTVAKYGYEVQILKRDLTWKEAGELEKILISYYGRIDLETGTLVNMTDGGEYGTVGRIMSDEQKDKLRVTTSKFFKGLPKSEETKKKISVAHLGVKKSKEAVQKSAATRVKNRSEINNFICTGTLKTWGTITKCAEDIGITYHMLSSYLNPNKIERNTTTIMRYEDYLKYGVIPPLPKVNEKIASINVETKEIFNSLRSASMSMGIDHKTLKRKLTGKSKNNTSLMLLSEYEEIYGKVNKQELILLLK